jgi:hypothetical protein
MSDLEMFADTLTLIREDDSIQALNQFRCCRRRMTARGSAAISLSDADRFGVGRNGLSLTSSGRPRRTRAVYGDGQRRRPGREYPTRAQPARLPDDQSLHPRQGGADFPGSTGRTGTGPFPQPQTLQRKDRMIARTRVETIGRCLPLESKTFACCFTSFNPGSDALDGQQP